MPMVELSASDPRPGFPRTLAQCRHSLSVLDRMVRARKTKIEDP